MTDTTTNELVLLFDKHLAAGDASFVEEDYETALQLYNKTEPTSDLQRFRLLHHRSAVYYQLQKYQACYQDAVTARNLQLQDVLSKSEMEGVLRKLGMAAFQLSLYEHAKEALQAAQTIATTNTNTSSFQYDALLEMIDSKLVASSKAPPTSTTTTTEPSNKSDSTTSSKTPNPTATTTTTKQQKIIPPKYQYYQSDKFMTIAILERNVQADQLDVQIEADSIVIQLQKQGQHFTVIAGMLSESINVEQSKIQIKDEKVLVKLRKIEAKEWYDLLDPKKKLRVATTTTASKSNTNNNTRPYSSTKDWNQIEQTLKQDEDNEQPQGDEAMNKLFQQIYANADPDTRRAMIKSYQTSGGTCLSTNWKEVEKKDYEKERTAPQGQEWRTWEGDKLPMAEDD